MTQQSIIIIFLIMPISVIALLLVLNLISVCAKLNYSEVKLPWWRCIIAIWTLKCINYKIKSSIGISLLPTTYHGTTNSADECSDIVRQSMAVGAPTPTAAETIPVLDHHR